VEQTRPNSVRLSYKTPILCHAQQHAASRSCQDRTGAIDLEVEHGHVGLQRQRLSAGGNRTWHDLLV
jgi:hypothetical protein